MSKLSKLAKFRRNPALFFRDSRAAWIRALGRASEPLWSRDDVRDLLLDPARSIAPLPIVGEAAAWLAARRAGRRRELLASAGEPSVSIIMAAHDAAGTIESAIESIRGQSYSRFELIVVDDASSDDTAERVLAIARNDERIELVRAPSNRGAAQARNLGLARAGGDVVTFHDADDRSHPERLERQLAALVAAPSALLSVCSSQREDSEGRVVEVNGRRVAKAVITMMFWRQRVLARIGYFRALPVSEDAEYYERIKAVFGHGSEVVLLDRLYFQLFRPGSLLFSDGEVSRAARAVRHQRSSGAEAAWAAIREQLRRIRAGDESPYVPLAE